MNKKECFNKFITGARCRRDEYLAALDYYNETVDENEKEQFLNILRNIGSKLFDKIITNKTAALNAFLRVRNLTSDDLPYFISSYLVTCKDTTKVITYFSQIYNGTNNFYSYLINQCNNTSWTKEELASIASTLNISLDMLLNLLKEYFTKNDKSEEYNQLLKSLNKNSKSPKISTKKSKYNHIYEMFLDNVSFSTILEYINKENIDIDNLKYGGLTTFVSNYSLLQGIESAIEIKGKLQNKINAFLEYKKKYIDIQKLKIKKSYLGLEIFQTKRFITEIIYNPKREEILQRITQEQLIPYLCLLKKYDSKLHSLFMTIVKGANEIDDSFPIKELIDLIIRGINENNTLRPFDILDYYQVFSIPLDRLIKYFPILNKNERIVLGQFINSNQATPLNPLSIIDASVNSLDNSTSAEETIIIIDYLIVNNIPINTITFNTAKRRLLNNLMNNAQSNNLK